MKTLAYLLGARALDLAHENTPTPARVPEPDLPPIASTPGTAAAWRRWAKDGLGFGAPEPERTAVRAMLRPARGSQA
jgi:hypothetical protein